MSTVNFALVSLIACENVPESSGLCERGSVFRAAREATCRTALVESWHELGW